MKVTASLRIQLMADNVLVAESEDAELWRRVFTAIQRGSSASHGTEGLDDFSEDAQRTAGQRVNSSSKGGEGIEGLALEVGVQPEDLEGACGPRAEAPFIHLDEHYWEALKSKTPVRGPSSISPLALAGTMLCVWFKYAKIASSPTMEQCQAVLRTINLRDANAARSIRNCSWLQARDGGVIINPAQRSKAVRLIKAYCLRKAPSELEQTEA